jgi:hypothetical protein
VALGKQAAQESPLSHRGFPAQSPPRQSTPTALEATHLKNLHRGLVRIAAVLKGEGSQTFSWDHFRAWRRASSSLGRDPEEDTLTRSRSEFLEKFSGEHAASKGGSI